MAIAQHRDTLAVVHPIKENLKDAKPSSANKRLRSNDAYDQSLAAILLAHLLGLDLALAVRANADQGVRLIQWVVLRHPVDGGGRDVYHTRRAEPLAHSQHVPRTLHIDLANIFGFPQGQASRRMHYHVGAGQFAFERRHIAHVAARPGDAFRIIFGMELANVEQVNVCPLSQLIGQMVTQESRSPGNDETHQIPFPLRVFRIDWAPRAKAGALQDRQTWIFREGWLFFA